MNPTAGPPSKTPLVVHLGRVFLGIIFVSAGASKLIPGYPGIIGPVWLVDRLEPFGLGFFGQFVAVSELAVGALLLIPGLATLGAIMLVPMLVSIFVVTISLGWQGTPYVLAFLLLVNAGLILYDYPLWRSLLPARRNSAPGIRSLPAWTWRDLAWILILAVLLAAPALLPGPGPLRLLATSGAVMAGLVWMERLGPERRSRA